MSSGKVTSFLTSLGSKADDAV